MSTQTKGEFLDNVRYHASYLEARLKWLAEPSTNHAVDLDPELKGMFEECERYERLMVESAIKLSRRCKEKLER